MPKTPNRKSNHAFRKEAPKATAKTEAKREATTDAKSGAKTAPKAASKIAGKADESSAKKRADKKSVVQPVPQDPSVADAARSLSNNSGAGPRRLDSTQDGHAKMKRSKRELLAESNTKRDGQEAMRRQERIGTNGAEIGSATSDGEDTRSKADSRSEAKSQEPREGRFPVVVIGASAGGYEAVDELLRNLKASGLSILFIQHLAPNQEKSLQKLLQRSSPYPIVEVQEGVDIAPDTLYVVPPSQYALLHGRFVKIDVHSNESPIDSFFRSVAEDQGSHTVGVLLSGMGSDGSHGLGAIKEAAGITFAQDSSAKFDSMPNSAIATGIVDYVQSPQLIARNLGRIVQSPYLKPTDGRSAQALFKNDENLNRIFVLLRNGTGVDFSTYKDTTVKRRIFRRMVLARFDKLDTYLSYLANNQSELFALYEDLLINVTNFFRDPESWVALRLKVFPEISAKRDMDTPIRVWCAGCATGEEAYSMAIALSEYLAEMNSHVPIQIFATDVSDRAIDFARRGIYPESIAQDVSPERLRRYFKKVEGGWQVNKAIRDLCVFARQNMIKDPPFSRLDMLSCRNVLIYLGAPMQKQLIRTFHMALKPTGYLMLGTSETIGLSADLFQLIDKKYKLYSRKPVIASPPPHTPPRFIRLESREIVSRPPEEARGSTQELQREADRIVLQFHSPAGVIIDDTMEIVQFRGQTSAYLEPAPGMASLNLLKMAREGLRVELRSTVNKARKTGSVARSEGAAVARDGKVTTVAVSAAPIKNPIGKHHYFLVLFEDVATFEMEQTPVPRKGRKRSPTEYERQIEVLTQQLEETKEHLQRDIEDQDAYYEELKSANEEIQSSNEELQSTNEELETAKEELQSINEEITTLNDELQIRNAELIQANNDLSNLLANMNFAVVMVGIDLSIRRFNPMAEKILNIIPTDIGRPIGDIRPNIMMDDLEQRIARVIDTLSVDDTEVRDRNGKWFSLSIRPYKTSDNKIDGAVVLMLDMSAWKRLLVSAEQQEELARILMERVPNAAVIVNPQFQIESANTLFHTMLGLRPEETERQVLFDIGRGELNIPGLRDALRDVLDHGTTLMGFEITAENWANEQQYRVDAKRVSTDEPHVLVILEPTSKNANA